MRSRTSNAVEEVFLALRGESREIKEVPLTINRAYINNQKAAEQKGKENSEQDIPSPTDFPCSLIFLFSYFLGNFFQYTFNRLSQHI